jgi:tRNA pseudouridine55 synthase
VTGVQTCALPIYSALKHLGKPLYDYARAGIEIERNPRTVQIHALDIDALNGDELAIRVHCSGGTYIRTLAEDLGKNLGCGAHLIALERTASGSFDLVEACTLEYLDNLSSEARLSRLLSPEVLVAHLPFVDIDAASALSLMQGKHVAKPADCPGTGRVRVHAPQGFIGLADVSETLVPARLMATQ